MLTEIKFCLCMKLICLHQYVHLSMITNYK